MAVIGDNPSNSELVIGGKLNGVATKLERGSRVVNSTDTRNLLGGLSSMLRLQWFEWSDNWCYYK